MSPVTGVDGSSEAAHPGRERMKRLADELDPDGAGTIDDAATDRTGRDVANEPADETGGAAVAGDRHEGRAVALALRVRDAVRVGHIVDVERRHLDDVVGGVASAVRDAVAIADRDEGDLAVLRVD